MILALDVSTKMGWARSDGASELFDMTVYDDYADMAHALMNYLNILLKPVTLCVIERPFIGSRNQYTTNGLVWTAHMACKKAGVERTEVGPKTWRKAVFGSASMRTTEAKKRAIAWCRERDIEPIDDNHAEAFCILEWAQTCMGRKAA